MSNLEQDLVDYFCSFDGPSDTTLLKVIGSFPVSLPTSMPVEAQPSQRNWRWSGLNNRHHGKD